VKYGREMADPILPTTCDFHVKCRDLLHAANLRHGTEGFTSPPKEGMLRIFFFTKSTPEKKQRPATSVKDVFRVLHEDNHKS
jgi:hypothetical protein